MNAEVDAKSIVIETERLLLRCWKKKDLNDLYQYARVDGVGQMAGWLPHRNKGESKAILDTFIAGNHTLAIVFKQNGKVIGSVGIDKYNEKLTEFDGLQGRELGFVLSKDYWGQGIMPEAVEGVCRFFFDQKGFDFFTCGYFEKNGRSKRVQEKCHFEPFRKLLFDTHFGTQEKGVLNLRFNDKKSYLINYSHPETLTCETRRTDILGANRTDADEVVSCRAFVIRGDEILTCYAQGRVMLPGGRLESGETLSGCVEREVQEETGVKVRATKRFLTVCEHYDDWKKTTHYFVCDVVGCGKQSLTEDETERGFVVRWEKIADVISEFAKYQDVADDGVKRNAYLREYNAMKQFISETEE